MGNQYLIEHRKAGFIVLGTLLAVVSLLAFVTYTNRDLATQSTLLFWAIQNHTVIMFFLILVSVGFGFFWSSTLYKEIESQTKTTKSIMDVVLRFLGADERIILNFLIDNGGRTTQAEISRLPRMNKVKAYRSLQKMQEKRILTIVPHGKIRQIQLRDDILETLCE